MVKKYISTSSTINKLSVKIDKLIEKKWKTDINLMTVKRNELIKVVEEYIVAKKEKSPTKELKTEILKKFESFKAVLLRTEIIENTVINDTPDSENNISDWVDDTSNSINNILWKNTWGSSISWWAVSTIKLYISDNNVINQVWVKIDKLITKYKKTSSNPALFLRNKVLRLLENYVVIKKQRIIEISDKIKLRILTKNIKNNVKNFIKNLKN